MHPYQRPIICPFQQVLSRPFSSSTPSSARPARSALKASHKNIPTYPHGPSLLYQQSNFGLYGNVRPQFGNMVSEKNEIKTRRKWELNIHDKRLWSVALNKFVKVKVQARVLRTIDKVGGLDEYLLGESPARIRELGMGGWKLKWHLLQDRGVKERLRKRRSELGVRARGAEVWLPDEELLGKDANTEEAMQNQIEFRIEEAGEESGNGDAVISEQEVDRLLNEDEAERARRASAFMQEQPPGEQPRSSP
ncbi:MAG: hypothetical protein Q9220_004767 [cf. Caloplaca sp. 1 TL-2023]